VATIEDLEAREEIDETMPGPCPGRNSVGNDYPDRTSEHRDGETEEEQTDEKPSFHGVLLHP
jgi:hypothetical protein